MSNISDSAHKLRRDLAAMTAMAEQMAAYLDNESVLFWPLVNPALPRLTCGGFLLRRHRLVALFDLFTSEEQAQVQAALTSFFGALEGRTVRFERKAGQELDARLRQWAAGLADVMREARQGGTTAAHYATVVEIRAMIDALVEELNEFPYRLEAQAAQRLAELDLHLRARWLPGPFVWPAEWQPAYPESSYWWLYGRPR